MVFESVDWIVVERNADSPDSVTTESTGWWFVMSVKRSGWSLMFRRLINTHPSWMPDAPSVTSHCGDRKAAGPTKATFKCWAGKPPSMLRLTRRRSRMKERLRSLSSPLPIDVHGSNLRPLSLVDHLVPGRSSRSFCQPPSIGQRSFGLSGRITTNRRLFRQRSPTHTFPAWHVRRWPIRR